MIFCNLYETLFRVQFYRKFKKQKNQQRINQVSQSIISQIMGHWENINLYCGMKTNWCCCPPPYCLCPKNPKYSKSTVYNSQISCYVEYMKNECKLVCDKRCILEIVVATCTLRKLTYVRTCMFACVSRCVTVRYCNIITALPTQMRTQKH